MCDVSKCEIGCFVCVCGGGQSRPYDIAPSPWQLADPLKILWAAADDVMCYYSNKRGSMQGSDSEAALHVLMSLCLRSFQMVSTQITLCL